MEIENPLLIPNLVWKIALAVTVVLIVIRAGVYVFARNRKNRMAGNRDGRVDYLDEKDEVQVQNTKDN